MSRASTTANNISQPIPARQCNSVLHHENGSLLNIRLAIFSCFLLLANQIACLFQPQFIGNFSRLSIIGEIRFSLCVRKVRSLLLGSFNFNVLPQLLKRLFWSFYLLMWEGCGCSLKINKENCLFFIRVICSEQLQLNILNVRYCATLFFLFVGDLNGLVCRIFKYY